VLSETREDGSCFLNNSLPTLWPGVETGEAQYDVREAKYQSPDGHLSLISTKKKTIFKR